MPRAFLIKKKKCYNVHGGQDEHPIGQIIEDEEELFPKTKKRKSYEAMATRLKNEMQTWSNDKPTNYDSGSESGCYSTSSRSPSPAITNPSKSPPTTIPSSTYVNPLTAHHPLFHVADSTSSPSPIQMLDPLKINPWMRPFLSSYLPINFAYPYQLPAETPYQHYGASRASPLYHTRVEPPSPSYPSQLSPYTPAGHHDSTNKIVEKQLKLASPSMTATSSTPSPSPSTQSWSGIERCSSNESSDTMATKLDSNDNKMLVKRCRTTDGSNGGARYQCPDCNKSYSTYSGLSKHQQFHCASTNKRSFSCKYCDKVYMSLGALKMHIRTHTLPCKCDLCGKAFSRPWLLQGHIRTHTGEKPFSCTHCNRAFADRSNLRAHLQTHSDVKKYSCKLCSKTFSRMSLLLKHEDSNCCTNTTINSQ
ncbi:snail [Chamberlinius hualienensis]